MNRKYQRYNSKKQKKLISEINVTPFVDVMLVLLIIFMITAPLLKTGIELELPAVDTPNIQENEDPLVISINKNNEIFLSDKITLIQKLNPKLAEYSAQNSFSLILKKKDIILGKTDLDITKDVLKIFNEKVKKIN